MIVITYRRNIKVSIKKKKNSNTNDLLQFSELETKKLIVVF